MYALVELSSRVSFFVCSVYIHIPVTPGPKMCIAPSQLKSSLSHGQDTCSTHACIYALGRKGKYFNKLNSFVFFFLFCEQKRSFVEVFSKFSPVKLVLLALAIQSVTNENKNCSVIIKTYSTTYLLSAPPPLHSLSFNCWNDALLALMNYLLFLSFNILESLICGRIAVAAVEIAAQSGSVFSLPQCCHQLHAIPHFFVLRCYLQNLDSYVTKYFRTIYQEIPAPAMPLMS